MMRAPGTAVLARAAILLAALAVACLLLAGCGPGGGPAPHTTALSPLPDPARDYVSAIAGGYVYYLAPAPGGAGFYLRRLGVPASCRAPASTR